MHESIWKDLLGTAFTQGWIDVDGVSTRYLRAGNSENPKLIFLHGTGGHAEAYVRNLKAHSEYFDVWAIDMIGHGWTDDSAVDLEIQNYVLFLLQFMNKAGIKKSHLSGESLGGWVAARFAIEYPDRVERLVLNTTGGSRSEPTVMERIKALSMQAVTNPTWDFIKARVEWLMADKSKAHEDLIATRQAIYAQPGAILRMKRCLVLQEMDVRLRNVLKAEDYCRIKAPTLVLWTSDDPTADVVEGRRVASMIPGALFTVMQGCGHWPQFEDPVTFNRIHTNFLLGNNVPEAGPVEKSIGN